jgi:mono/diheme cytochrome c family protein
VSIAARPRVRQAGGMCKAPAKCALRVSALTAAKLLVSALCCTTAGISRPGVVAGAEVDEAIRAILAQHCLECHSGQRPKGDLGLDRLALDFADPGVERQWLAVNRRVRAGEMPPEKKPRLPAEDVQALSDWLAEKVEAAALARRGREGRVVLRRLNRTEYQNTIRDLLGIEIELKESLPLDTAAHGFDNVGQALHTSSFLIDKYLEAAEAALAVAIANGPQPPAIDKRYSLQESHEFKSSQERVYRPSADGAVVLFSSSHWNAVTLTPFYPPHRGRYRFRISASAVQSDGKPVSYRVDAGPMLMGTTNHLVNYFDAVAEPTTVEFVDHLEARSTIRVLPYGLARAQSVNQIGAESYTGPGLAVQWVEVAGPLHDNWPPESHRRIFGELPQSPAPTANHPERVEVVSDDPAADAEEILRRFAGRAFRRTASDADLQPYLDLVASKRADGHSFEQAVRVGLAAVLTSPEFLFFRERPGRLDDFALANRLSYFLWSTMPDEELLALAEGRTLSRPDILHGQVERMLNDPRSAAFTESFVGQWLGLRDIDFTMPSEILYPEFDEMLRESMVREVVVFFSEVLKNDLGLTNSVSSDFTMLNGRLARHYGIGGVEGWAFHKVPLPPDCHRGGVLTMAAVLKVTANGTNTSPVMRGAWVLDRILGTPPPPPPENVAALEPDIRGTTTIRQQLARHRQIAACAGCHSRIDPAGFALENFDVIGGWREHYRTSGIGKEVIVDGRRMPYLQGPPVEPADVLADGRSFKNIDDLRQLLLTDKDQLARALATRLITYATGGAPEAVDQSKIEAIVAQTRAHDYGLRTLIHEIVASDLFREK